MPVFVVGDVQGCREALERLLDRLNFDSGSDLIWFTGDLVRRGPDSIGVLRLVRDLGSSAVCVLGNHDLHLLAQAAGVGKDKGGEAAAVSHATDGPALLDWLRQLPLFHNDRALGAAMVHAGLLPAWDIEQACELAAEVESVLRAGDSATFFRHMYGNEPDSWDPDLAGWDRLRVIVNAMTRLRYCDDRGGMHLVHAGPPGTQERGLLPWFDVPGRRSAGRRVYFGHWSTLGLGGAGGAQGLDTGCVWGGQLTALCVDDPGRAPIAVKCPESARPGGGG